MKMKLYKGSNKDTPTLLAHILCDVRAKSDYKRGGDIWMLILDYCMC